MASSKDKLTSMLSGEIASSPAIKRGKGMQLSTEKQEPEVPALETSSAKSHNRTNAQSHQSEVKRVNRGYKLREDLIKDCKRHALETGKPLYEVMEAALTEYLEHHRTNAQSH